MLIGNGSGSMEFPDAFARLTNFVSMVSFNVSAPHHSLCRFLNRQLRLLHCAICGTRSNQFVVRTVGDDASLITGPGIGPEGSLEPRARDNGVPVHLIPQLRRQAAGLSFPWFQIQFSALHCSGERCR